MWKLRTRLAQAIAPTRLYQLYNRRFGVFEGRTISHFINEYSRVRDNVFFVQVGGNDGRTLDPYHFFVRRDRWKGVVIEPQRQVFDEKLCVTYAAMPEIKLLNVAIDVADGIRSLYKFSFSSARWATGLASFDRGRLIANFNSDFVQRNIEREGLTVPDNPNEYITTEPVTCIAFETLLGRLERKDVDFLITDVEGLDIQILETFPLERVRPANIVFELPVQMDASFGAFLEKLSAYEYDVFIERRDAIAMRRSGYEQ